MPGKLNVSFLWHMHQPYYRDPNTGRYAMPWVRLHATKGYLDMIEAVLRFGGKGVTFNIVPSLLLQLNDLAEGQDEDDYLRLSLKTPDQLEPVEKGTILRHFFSANHDNLVLPYRRYKKLLQKRGFDLSHQGIDAAVKRFNETDFRDLQVWFNLTWFGWAAGEKYDLLRALKKKGQDFTEDEKVSLLDLQREVLGNIISTYKGAWDQGLIDISTSPFYHPILPLLIDNRSAKISQPRDPMPEELFQRPEDAEIQLKRARKYIKSQFGRYPTGLWPSEGSVSPAACELAAEADFKWLGTDERILMATLPGLKREEIIYSGYKTRDDGPTIYFRDQGLSDAIGFRYAKNPSKRSVADFIGHLEMIAASFKSPEEHIVSVILDGENAWEYFPDGGKAFFEELYGRLQNHKNVQLTSFSDFSTKQQEHKVLPPIFPASWINGSFRIWIGEPIKNIAWDHLAKAAKLIGEHEKQKPKPKGLKKIKELLYIAEGSDWFWWYGTPNSSDFDAEFDYLFRANLLQIYSSLGVEPPDELKQPLVGETLPVEFKDFFPIHPIIDGKETHYYEWLGAVKITSGDYSGAMNIGKTFITKLFYGLSENHLFIRVDAPAEFWSTTGQEIIIQVERERQSAVSIRNLQNTDDLLINWQGELPPKEMPEAALDRCLEIQIPFANFSCPDQRIKFAICVKRNNLEIERWPREGGFACPCPSDELFGSNWLV
ncbi:hypothetical protein KJ564_16150 [bacterium]|nr:hypothetical protein [bacterium]